jgi:hypothetical protein
MQKEILLTITVLVLTLLWTGISSYPQAETEDLLSEDLGSGSGSGDVDLGTGVGVDTEPDVRIQEPIYYILIHSFCLAFFFLQTIAILLEVYVLVRWVSPAKISHEHSVPKTIVSQAQVSRRIPGISDIRSSRDTILSNLVNTQIRI